MAKRGLHQSLTEKKRFFDGLYALDENADDRDGESSTIYPRQQYAQAQIEQPPRNVFERLRRPQSILTRSASDTDLITNPQATSVFPAPSLSKPDRPSTLKLLGTDSMSNQTSDGGIDLLSAVPSNKLGKRKRESTSKHVPNKLQIFKGLQFYFFPSSDAHPARKMRITKAVEFGATWSKNWTDQVTHAILDKSISFETLLKYLKVDIPNHVLVVNETWPSECIAYQALLDARSEQFKPLGYQERSTGKNSNNVDKSHPTHPTSSPQLKPAMAAGTIRNPETPEAEAVRTGTTSTVLLNSSTLKVPYLKHDATENISNNAATTSELEAAIKQAKAFQNLPLEDDSDISRPNTSDGPNGNITDTEDLSLKTRSKALAYQDKFQCMKPHSRDSLDNPNSATIAILDQMADYYTKIGDAWRPRAYRNAMSTLRTQTNRIATKAEAVNLPFVGERLAAKIEEIAYTNRLRRLDNARAEPSDHILQTFMGVYGIGYSQASKWVSQGFTTLDELLEKANLSDSQRIGLEHYSDFNSRIPRAEVAEHGNLVFTALQEIDKRFELIIGGSYRRGAQFCGDIDCIITHPFHSPSALIQILLNQLVPALFRLGFLKASLATSNPGGEVDVGSKWHGASCLPSCSIWRRIDLLLVPASELGAAMIYFTGNDIFNRSLRLLASHKGMRLNQRGLYKDVIRGKARVKVTEGMLVEGRDERKIFEALGVPWRPPHERVC